MTSIADSKPQVIDLSPEEFIRLSNPPRLIDVRSSFEYAMFYAPDTVNLSLPRILIGVNSWLRCWVLPQWFQELPKDEPIALICLTSHRSPIVAKQLTKAGFTKVYNITGGMMEWRRLGLPTCKGK
jgi:rhodanese-related sulfurtransferase